MPPGVGMVSAGLSSGESSVSSGLTAANCGCPVCELCHSTSQRKPVGAGVRLRVGLAYHLPYWVSETMSKSYFNHFLLLIGEGEILPPVYT